MGNKLTPAQKQTKLRSGIQPMQIMIFTNYLAKPQFPLTSDLFEFPQISNKPSGLEKYPLISTNVKYNFTRMRYLTHPQRVQIFFSFSRLMQFISKQPIKNESEKNEVLKHNTRFMLEMLFPISYPVVKKMKTASDEYSMMSIFDAAEKEFVYQKFNTYLKLDGKSCTVDEIRFADTFGANPIYVKLYDLAKDFLVKRDAAVMVLHGDMKTRLGEFKNAFDPNNDDAVLARITDEINKLNSGSAGDTSAVDELTKEIAQIQTDIVETDKKITDANELQQKETDLLQYRSKGLSGAVSSMNAIYKNMYDFSNKNTLNVITDTNVNKLRDDNKYVEGLIKTAETAKIAAKAATKGKPKDDTVEKIEILIYGLTSLYEYNELKSKMPYITATMNLSQFVKELQSEQSDLKKEIVTKTKQMDALKKKAIIDFTFIGTGASFTASNIKSALADTSKKSKIKSLNSSLQKMVDEYEIKSVLKQLLTKIKTSVTEFDTEIKRANAKDESVNTTVFLSDIKTMKDAVKSVYESDVNYFSQRNPLAEAFMRLRKICGFAYLITTMHQQQENMNIEREYNINYNIDADLKKGEYLFHKKTTEDLRAYYYPNRQSMEPGIKSIVSVKDIDEINMDAIVTMFEDKPKTSAAIDLIDLQGKPRYECQVQMVVVGGVITEENSTKIDCSYQDLILGADILKEYFNLIVPQFTDLTQEIADAEKKYNIKYEKIKLEDTIDAGAGPNVGVMPTLPAVPAAMPAMPTAPPAPPAPPKKTATTVTDADLDNIISKNMPPGASSTFLRDFIKNTDYKDVKVFLETAINYFEKSSTNPNEIIPGTKKTYKNDYEEKKIDAEQIIKSNIKKKEIKAKDTTISSTDIGMINREIGMLKAFKQIVDKVDENMRENWLRLPRITGGKKTRKRRRQQQRIKRNTRRQLK